MNPNEQAAERLAAVLRRLASAVSDYEKQVALGLGEREKDAFWLRLARTILLNLSEESPKTMNITEDELQKMEFLQSQSYEPNDVVGTRERMKRILEDLRDLRSREVELEKAEALIKGKKEG